LEVKDQASETRASAADPSMAMRQPGKPKRHSLDPDALLHSPKKGLFKRSSRRHSTTALRCVEDADSPLATPNIRTPKHSVTFTSYKDGYLKKRSVNSKYIHNWKTRYFLVVDGGITYYKSVGPIYMKISFDVHI
jgi:hypothetical protein